MLRRTLAIAAALPIVTVAALLLAGCPDHGAGDTPDAAHEDEGGVDAASPCETGYLGDPSKDPVMELRTLRADGTDVPIKNGDDLALIFPPQGGRVAFVGVRVTNIDGCGMTIIGALRDPISKRVQVDGRTVNLRREADGWGTTGRGTTTKLEDSAAIGDYSNVPICPNQWADQDIYDKPFTLEVKVSDRFRKKTASASITVTPRCAEAGEKLTACRCLCKNGYKLGESCGEDAGADGAL